MFNLFPEKKSVDVILEETNNLYPTWTWTSSIKDADGKDVSVADLISKYNEAMKEIKNLNQLKDENVQLIERINEIDSDINKEYQAEIFTLKNDIAVLKAKYQILDHNYQGCTKYRDEYKHQLDAANKEIEALKKKFDNDKFMDQLESHSQNYDLKVLVKENTSLKEENEKLKKDIIDYVFEKDDEIEKLKAQKHPMYPIHWGGWDKVEITTSSTDKWVCPCNKCKDTRAGKEDKTWEEAASDLALRVVKLEKKVEELTIIKHTSDPNYKYFLEPEKWSTTKVAMDDAVQAKQREVYGIEEKKAFKPWVEGPVD
jgi:hypothetical protein